MLDIYDVHMLSPLHQIIVQPFRIDAVRDQLPELFEKWKDGQLKWLDPEAEVDFAKVLIDCQYYKEAMQIVEKKEALGQVSTY